VATSSPFKAELALIEQMKKKKNGAESAESKISKPHGKKKSSTSASTKTAKKRRKLNLSAAVDGDEELCSYCGYRYGSPDDPLLEDEWYICMQCGGNPPKWFHENCGRLAKKRFTCYNCLPDK